METTYVNGYVCKRVESIHDVITAMNADLEFFDKYGNGFRWDDGIKKGVLSCPTEKEVVERIIESLEETGYVYAGFYLDCGTVVPDENTVLTSRFKVGQAVYYMSDGRIAKGCINSVILLDENGEKGCVIMVDDERKDGDEVFATVDQLLQHLKESIQ